MSTYIYKYPKDLELKGQFVKRCKCGARPYYDRIFPGPPERSCWIACNCGRKSLSSFEKEGAIENWNNDFLDYN